MPARANLENRVPKKTRKALPPINERISFLMHRIDAELALICNPVFRHLDVVLHNSRILVILLEAGSVKVGDLVRLMVLPQSTISHQLRELEKRKLIRRTQGTEDSRSIIVALTAKGRGVAKQCNAMSRDVYDAMVGDLSRGELETLRSQLRGMFERLEALQERKYSERRAPAKRRKAA